MKNTHSLDKTGLNERIQKIVKNYPVKHVGVVGSYARGEQSQGSDLDLLVEFREGATLFDVVRMKEELTKKLKVTIDIISKNAKLHNVVKQKINNELIPII